MLKGKTIYLRPLEVEDYEKTYVWHNDSELQKTTMGPVYVVSKEIERSWIQTKCSNNQKDIYFAICSNDNNEMIGFCSINDIDYKNRVCTGGVVIGDKQYRDGTALIESHFLKINYAFDQLNIHRYETSCLEGHLMSFALIKAFFFEYEGTSREKIFKNGKYNNICNFSLLVDDYYSHLKAGDFEYPKILKRIVSILKQKKY